MHKKPRLSCQRCGAPCKRATTKFCSSLCWGKYRSEQKIGIGGPKKIKTLPRACIQCGKQYVPHNGKQKYCSRHCMGVARRDEFLTKVVPLKSKEMSAAQRNLLSRLASERNAERTYTKGIGGIREDIGHYVRSRWEANFARYLLFTNQSYQYEPIVFTLILDDKKCSTTKIRYTPDFKVGGIFYEVKGWWDKKSLLRKRLMEEQYPEIHIEYISEQEYLNLQFQFGEQIENWEFK
jgi:hypothetical protein